jgi:alpha-galactosidase
MSPDNPVVRFKYKLTSKRQSKLTKVSGKDNIIYFSTVEQSFDEVTEVQLSNYDEKIHSFILKEQKLEKRFFENQKTVMGPILVLKKNNSSFLTAYEHGSEYGEEFLHFNLMKNYNISLAAVKGNYLADQIIDNATAYESIWFQVAGVQGDDANLAEAYRTFMMKYISENKESREPYIFYNTWGRQERVKWAGGTYLESMNLKMTLQEIERAHKMGVDVYVIDTGWYKKTGDWNVNIDPNFFPDSLKQVKDLLDKYNMKLGLWFNPRMAALSSNMFKKNERYRTSIDGEMGDTEMVWETEESAPLCIVSPYWEDFADRLIELVDEVGVSYFKWDALWQQDCNAAGHNHGTLKNTPQERYDRDGFLMSVYLSKIIDKVSKVQPETIFDFDITEGGRPVGLSFLASGKYFAINNGPYYHNLDVSPKWESPLQNGNVQVFVNPGPARPWYMRPILTYDKWIPSVLFLTHYQPDEPRNSQLINVASLILGQNGIWGEILKTSPEGVDLFNEILQKYKIVKNDITFSSLIPYGSPGESIEIYEKINPETGKGVVVMFGKGQIEYVTKSKVDLKTWKSDAVTLELDSKGRAVINTVFDETSAKIVFFGVQ